MKMENKEIFSKQETVEKFYALYYRGCSCKNKEELEEFNYYLSKGAKVKLLQVAGGVPAEICDIESIHSIVIEIPSVVYKLGTNRSNAFGKNK